MATGNISFSGTGYKFDIGYEYTNTSFRLKSVKTTAVQSGWGVWELQPTLFIYALKGSTPVPKANQQYDAAGTTIKSHVESNKGVWQIAYNGNNPGAYLPNTSGQSATWSSADFNDISLSLSGSSVTITVGAAIANTTGQLNDAVYGSQTVTLTLYSAPSGYNIEVTSFDNTSITVRHNWTAGSVAVGNYPTRSITLKSANNDYTETKTAVGAGGSATFTGLIPNTSYTIAGVANDGTTNLAKTVNQYTSVAQPSDMTVTATTNSLVVKASSSNNTTNLKYRYALTNSDGTVTTYAGNASESVAFSSLVSNYNYSIVVTAYNSLTNTNSASRTFTSWTRPMLDSSKGLVLRLASGLEHDKINVTANAANSSIYDQYSFKINTGSYSDYNAAKNTEYSNLTENTQYTISVLLKNTNSGFVSEEVSKSITTWYDPISNLDLLLTKRWFWYLQTNANYKYNGTITKFEFAIGNEMYKSQGTTNSYSKGSTEGGAAGNLNYNTDYICKVKLTDNHGRTVEVSKTFRTLDERSLFVNGNLREVKLIKPDGSVIYITPNLLSAIKPDNTVVNMNQVINNDSRIEFK